MKNARTKARSVRAKIEKMKKRPYKREKCTGEIQENEKTPVKCGEWVDDRVPEEVRF